MTLILDAGGLILLVIFVLLIVQLIGLHYERRGPDPALDLSRVTVRIRQPFDERKWILFRRATHMRAMDYYRAELDARLAEHRPHLDALNARLAVISTPVVETPDPQAAPPRPLDFRLRLVSSSHV